MQNIDDYIDKYGLVCSRHITGTDEIGRKISSQFPWLDGGDSANRTLALVLAIYLTYRNRIPIDNSQYFKYMNNEIKYKRILAVLRCRKNEGNFRRHPDSLFWYSDCDRFSRDQAIPLLATFVYLDDKENLCRFFNAHLKRGLLFMTNTRRNGTTKQNHGKPYKLDTKKQKWIKRNYNWKLPDFTGPEIWALYIRGFNMWYLYPLLILFDIETLIGALKRRFDSDIDCINHVIISCIAAERMPTPTSWVTNKFINDADNLSSKLKRFYYQDTMPKFLADLWEPICKKFFGSSQ